MLYYGCTRLEIGVHSTYEDVARDTIRGTQLLLSLIVSAWLKMLGLKLCLTWT